MLRLIGVVASIGLADSLNPTTIAPALYLASGREPRRGVLQFTLGVAAVYILGGAVLVYGPGQLLLSLVPHPRPTVRYVLEILAGVVMLVGAGVLWYHRDRLAKRQLPSPPASGKSSLLVGATISAVELPTAFPYFAAIAAIVGSGLGPGHRLIALLIYNVCFVLPLLLILLTLIVAGDQAERILRAARDLLQSHWPAILAGIALLAGVFVTVLGVTGLTSAGHGHIARFSRHLRRFVH